MVTIVPRSSGKDPLPVARMTYDETMAWGAQQYQDVLDALAEVGLDGEFTQTGGMCAALQVTLDGGYYLLFTDKEDTLAWSRVEHEGWYVGLFEPEERRKGDGPIRYLLDPDGSSANAVELAVRVLRGESED
jgi:hypothetical protein